MARTIDCGQWAGWLLELAQESIEGVDEGECFDSGVGWDFSSDEGFPDEVLCLVVHLAELSDDWLGNSPYPWGWEHFRFSGVALDDADGVTDQFPGCGAWRRLESWSCLGLGVVRDYRFGLGVECPPKAILSVALFVSERFHADEPFDLAPAGGVGYLTSGEIVSGVFHVLVDFDVGVSADVATPVAVGVDGLESQKYAPGHVFLDVLLVGDGTEEEPASSGDHLGDGVVVKRQVSERVSDLDPGSFETHALRGLHDHFGGVAVGALVVVELHQHAIDLLLHATPLFRFRLLVQIHGELVFILLGLGHVLSLRPKDALLAPCATVM